MEKPQADLIGENLLVAIGYGDSLGLPVETKKPQVIQDTYGRIDRLHPITNPFYGEGSAGSYSDDTQLSLAMAQALIAAGGFDMDAMVRSHVDALDSTPTRTWRGNPVPRGWGKSTWESVLRLKADPGCHEVSGNPEGEGNGVLMKLAPLALWHSLRLTAEDDENLAVLTRMTHANDISVVTALTHRDVLVSIIRGEVQVEEVAELAEGLARSYEAQYSGAGDKTSKLLGKLALVEDLSADQILSIARHGGFHSPETLVMAYGAYMICPVYPGSSIEAVNLGGDTDSTGSIVAAMSVFRDPNVEHPLDIELLEDRQMLASTGANLVSAVQQMR